MTVLFGDVFVMAPMVANPFSGAFYGSIFKPSIIQLSIFLIFKAYWL
jgi:hypothetical protein